MSTSFANTTTTTTVAHMNRENIQLSTFPARTTTTTTTSAKALTSSYLQAPLADDVSLVTAPHFHFHSDHVNMNANANANQHREVAGNYSKQPPENFSSMSPNSFQGAILRMRAENNRIRTDIQRFKGTVEVR